MEKLTKEDAKKNIYYIFEFIDNGEVKTEYDTFYGHPGLYFFHSKSDLEKKIDESLNKDTYDKYDIYYIVNKLIKYMLGKYDSHTRAFFNTNIFLPIQLKIDNGLVHIINISPDLEDLKGAILLSINDIEISKLLEEIEKITCYSTEQYLQIIEESYLRHFGILKSLPSIDNYSTSLTYKVLYQNEIREIIFKENKLPKPIVNNAIENYSYNIIDNCIVIHYNHCRDKEKMLDLIDKIKVISKENNICNYIIDLRDNSGGDSSIIKPLINYLSDKNIVCLINEKVFSSGRMAAVDLKRIGAYLIGTDIATSLNAFGNVPGCLKVDNLDLTIQRSSTYWLYDKELNGKGFKKDTFSRYFDSRRELLEPIFLHPDELVNLSIEDILNNHDSQLECALLRFRNMKKIK